MYRVDLVRISLYIVYNRYARIFQDITTVKLSQETTNLL